MLKILIALLVSLCLSGVTYAHPDHQDLETPPPASKNDSAKDEAVMSPPSGSELLVQKLFELTNEQRTKNGLPALALNLRLNVAALTHSQEMFKLNYQSHHSPTPGRRTVKDRMALAGIRSRIQAENIFHCEGFPTEELAQLSIDQWMESSGHRANILRKEVSQMGLGVVNQDGKFYVTQVFAGGL